MSVYVTKERCEKLAEFLVKNNSTVRATAVFFGISKSTVHKDVSERLAKVDPTLHKKVKSILDKNKSERHIRGGNATKEKYLNMSKGIMCNNKKGT